MCVTFITFVINHFEQVQPICLLGVVVYSLAWLSFYMLKRHEYLTCVLLFVDFTSLSDTKGQLHRAYLNLSGDEIST